MNKNKVVFFGFLVGVLPLLASAEDKVILEHVEVVGATNAKQEYQEASFYKTYSSELITKEDIQEQSATNITDILKNVSNIQVKDRGSFSKVISIRGLSGERVVSVVDGSKMSNHGMTMGGGGELSLINTSSVEKIEVIKGSPSIVYDPGATGGVINISTIKNPRDMKDKVKLDYIFNYDGGYLLEKHIAKAELKYKDLFVSVGGSLASSDGRKVKDEAKQDSILHDLDEESGTKYAIQDLGYESDSLDLMANYQFMDHANIFYKRYESHADDITQAYGATNPQVFHYKDFDFESNNAGLNLKEFLGFQKADLIYSDSKQYKATHATSDSLDEVFLESQTVKLMLEKQVDSFVFLGGVQYTKDDADTLTLSNQDYFAAYLNANYIGKIFSYNVGIRYNKYKVRQELKPGQNPDTAKDLVGVSGILDQPLNDEALNYSFGLLYSLNENNNISMNYARTYRYPSLYERFAFGGGFIGGGEDMQAEEADNIELSYKYLSESMHIVATLFYSDFETYNSFRTHNSLKPEYSGNLQAFLDCQENLDCSPFDSIFKYESFENVKNKGFELDIEKRFDNYGLTLNFITSLSDTSDAEFQNSQMPEPMTVHFSQDPLEFGLHIKKNFHSAYKPWIKLQMRHVTDSPGVDQEDKYGNDDFSAFSVADIYFGAKNRYFTLNGGIRNITNEVYNEAYSPLDGLERTFFFNVGMSLETLL